MLEAAETRQLLDSIDASTRVGLGDRALIALMVFSFARVGAALAMRVEDVYVAQWRLWVRLANQASTCTTQLYDRRRDDVSLDEVERIRLQCDSFTDEAKPRRCMSLDDRGRVKTQKPSVLGCRFRLPKTLPGPYGAI